MAGSVLPAVSVAWGPPAHPSDSGYSVLFSDYEEFEGEWVCLGCVINDADEMLGRGLDLARRYGQVDRDDETGEWVVPPRELHWQTSE